MTRPKSGWTDAISASEQEQNNDKRRKRIEMAPLKSGWTGAISAYAQEQNNVDMAQQREPESTGEFERANDLSGAGIELPRDTPDDQDELKKLKGSKSRDMVDDLKSGRASAISAYAQEQNNVDMAQQREPESTGEFELANDLSGAGIELPRDTPDDQDELKKLKGSKSRDMVDDLKSGRTDAISTSEQEQNNVDMAQQREPESTGEFELANDLTRAGIELPCDSPDELKKLEESKSRDMIDDLKSGWTGAISAYAQEQNNVEMAQQREPESTGEFELAIDLTGAGIELPCDTPDELKKLKGSKSRDMVDFLKSGWTGAISAYAQEQNNVEMAQQREPESTGEFELAIDLTGAGIELPCDTPVELKKLKGSKSRDMVDFLKSGWTLLMTNLILEIASAVFDQMGYAFVGMVLAFVALLLATAELIYMERMAFVALLLSTAERMNLLPSFLLPRKESTFAPGKPDGTIVEYFGLVGAVWQCFYSTVDYAYARQKKDNPIKMCLLPFIFLLCVVISKVIKTEFIDDSA
ncbi:hypothetical protein DKX38_028895 [Salix brachista]|uniref:Uncharacterized protein n=1 Tax=Salix brachista TaxID=2182728 RepID=A0A5N5JA26_9ROSI|nr:hypothetical protein DKX38_028895 [Salix brachista]